MPPSSELIIPADMPHVVSEEVRRLAVAAFQEIEAAGMARVDFFVTHGDWRVYLNEINTIPGFTAISMYPKLWEASGLAYPELVDRLIVLALERYAERHRVRPSADADDDVRSWITGRSSIGSRRPTARSSWLRIERVANSV